MQHPFTTLAALLTAGLTLLVPSALFGQPRVTVSEVLPTLFGNTIVLTPTSTPEVPNHAAHFKPVWISCRRHSSSISRS